MNLPSITRNQPAPSDPEVARAGVRRTATYRPRALLSCAMATMLAQALFSLPAVAESTGNSHVALLRGHPASESLLIGYLLTNCKSEAALVSPRTKMLKVSTTLEETTGLIAPITESFELSAGEFHEISANFSYFGSGDSAHVVSKHLFFPLVNSEILTANGGGVFQSCELHITNTIVGPNQETQAAVISVLGLLSDNLQ